MRIRGFRRSDARARGGSSRRGAAAFEYCLLLMLIGIPVVAAARPLLLAVYWFISNVYFHLSMP